MNYYDEDFFYKLMLPSFDCLWDWCVLLLLEETRYGFLCKDNISCNNVYIIKILIFYIYILTVCMTT
jgi:hypothetical protein